MLASIQAAEKSAPLLSVVPEPESHQAFRAFLHSLDDAAFERLRKAFEA